MKIDCHICGHWLVAVYCQERPTPHLKCICCKCGAVWREPDSQLFEAEGANLGPKAVVIPSFGLAGFRTCRPSEVEPPMVRRRRLRLV